MQGDGAEMQDRIFVLPDSVVLLDGASTPDPEGFSASQYVDALGKRLLHLLGSSELSLRDLLAHAIADTAERYSLPQDASPSSTVVVVRWMGKDVDWIVLGDSALILFSRAGDVNRIRDNRIIAVGEHYRKAYRHRLARGHGYDAGHRDLLRSLTSEQRSYRNTRDGYWIAGTSPEAAYHALTGSCDISSLSAIILASDGAIAGPEMYGVPPSWTEALRLIRQEGIDRLLEAITHTEDRDPEGRRWPRSKVHDDKALAAMEIACTSSTS